MHRFQWSGLKAGCIGGVAAMMTLAVEGHAQMQTPTISLKSNESARLRGVTWTDLNCGSLFESLTGVDIMEAPAALKLRIEPGKVVVARPGCTKEVDGAYVFVETGPVETKLSGPLVIRARMQSKTGPVQATFRFNVILYPDSAEPKK